MHVVSDHDYNGLEEGSISTARRQDFKLTLSEFENIAQRYETSIISIAQINDVLDSKENMKAIREKVNRDCDQVTIKVEILSHYKTTQAAIPGVDVVIFKTRIVDLDKRGFLMIKTQRSKVKQFIDELVS